MIEVILVEMQHPGRDGVRKWFIELKGVPNASGGALVVCPALPWDKVQEVKKKIEDAMDAYRRPKRKGGRRKPKTSWERITREPV